jgi:hypothetical protein
MLRRRFRLFMIVAVCLAAFSAAPGARSQDFAEAARKAKAKKQQQQPDAALSATSVKPKTFTNEDFPESGGSASPGGAASPGQDVVGSSEKPAPGKDTAIVILNLPNSTVKHSGGAVALWSVKNTGPHHQSNREGPCGFHQEHPVRFRLNNGGGFGNRKSMGVSLYQDNCAGKYTFELRAESFHNTLSTATTTLKVL